MSTSSWLRCDGMRINNIRIYRHAGRRARLPTHPELRCDRLLPVARKADPASEGQRPQSGGTSEEPLLPPAMAGTYDLQHGPPTGSSLASPGDAGDPGQSSAEQEKATITKRTDVKLHVARRGAHASRRYEPEEPAAADFTSGGGLLARPDVEHMPSRCLLVHDRRRFPADRLTMPAPLSGGAKEVFAPGGDGTTILPAIPAPSRRAGAGQPHRMQPDPRRAVHPLSRPALPATA